MPKNSGLLVSNLAFFDLAIVKSPQPPLCINHEHVARWIAVGSERFSDLDTRRRLRRAKTADLTPMRVSGTPKALHVCSQGPGHEWVL